jgi:hypothetical protein
MVTIAIEDAKIRKISSDQMAIFDFRENFNIYLPLLAITMNHPAASSGVFTIRD